MTKMDLETPSSDLVCSQSEIPTVTIWTTVEPECSLPSREGKDTRYPPAHRHTASSIEESELPSRQASFSGHPALGILRQRLRKSRPIVFNTEATNHKHLSGGRQTPARLGNPEEPNPAPKNHDRANARPPQLRLPRLQRIYPTRRDVSNTQR